MGPVDVCISGITTWLGEPLAQAVADTEDLEVVAMVAAESAGRCIHGLRICATIAEALETPSQVVVELSAIDVALPNALAALAARRHVVVGGVTYGEDAIYALDQAARAAGVGCLIVENFSLSAMLVQHFAAHAANLLASWEIVDYGPDTKVDAPSGTAIDLAHRLSLLGRAPVSRAPASLQGAASRGASVMATQVHALRLPGHPHGMEVVFSGEDEKLSLRFESGRSPRPYVAGAVRAIRQVPTIVGVTRGLI